MPPQERGRHPSAYRELGVRVYRREHGPDSKSPSLKVRDAYLLRNRAVCDEIVQSSGLNRILNELGALMRDKEVDFQEEHDAAETLAYEMSIAWREEDSEEVEGDMLIAILPLTREIVVEGAIAVVVPPQVWGTEEGEHILRDVVLHTYRYPGKD